MRAQDADGAIAFIDLEASGLGAKSWPIEVGWALETGPSVSVLIRPDTSWAKEAWDPRAEKLHGLSMQALFAEGRDSADICEQLNRALGGKQVYSDAPDWDGFWLHRLFATSGVKQDFKVLDFLQLVQPLGRAALDPLDEQAAAIAPRLHRAGPDALHLQALYRLVRTARAS